MYRIDCILHVYWHSAFNIKGASDYHTVKLLIRIQNSIKHSLCYSIIWPLFCSVVNSLIIMIYLGLAVFVLFCTRESWIIMVLQDKAIKVVSMNVNVFSYFDRRPTHTHILNIQTKKHQTNLSSLFVKQYQSFHCNKIYIFFYYVTFQMYCNFENYLIVWVVIISAPLFHFTVSRFPFPVQNNNNQYDSNDCTSMFTKLKLQNHSVLFIFFSFSLFLIWTKIKWLCSFGNHLQVSTIHLFYVCVDI